MKSLKFLLIFISSTFFVDAKIDGGIFFNFYGSTYDDYKNTTLNFNFTSLINTKYYNSSKPTVFYVHGWRSGLTIISTESVVKAYLSRGDHNIIAVDWSKYSSNVDYIEVAASVKDQATFNTAVLGQMQTAGFNLSTFHFVGHSLGAQILGRVGYQFINNYSFKFKRITGLDPAGPLFANRNDDKLFQLEYPTLNKLNAEFVDIIHTDAGTFGSKFTTGHIDFRPNGGSSQPGCSLFECFFIGQDDCLSCDHGRAWKYYAESVNITTSTFIAKRCPNNVTDFTKSKCIGPETASMGFNADKYKVGGNYYLETNDRKLYSK
ncbi:hypothetical protein PVAND_017176 [Polypedilum vanderplanki]|uniref:Lipase domain-containing protein n=1 Tax=Polypedilum vanderplanki TaxID=319348 RepID=A0A9J6BIP2_POLVA|nr:hypothetical protein PVAND_017176 [Polypedilum vanderplanki]